MHKNYAERTAGTAVPNTLFNGDSVSTIEWGTNQTWDTLSSNPEVYGATTGDVIDNLLAGKLLVYHIDHGMSRNYVGSTKRSYWTNKMLHFRYGTRT